MPTQAPNKWINPEKQWFVDLIDEWRHAGGAHSSARSRTLLASVMGLNRSALSRRLDGAERFQPYELAAMAKVFRGGKDEIAVLLSEMTLRASRLRTAWEMHRALPRRRK